VMRVDDFLAFLKFELRGDQFDVVQILNHFF
jgi:hypothetical protein